MTSTSWYITGDREQVGVRLQPDGGQVQKELTNNNNNLQQPI